ncbi:MAG: response regulator [Chitinophagales bacterium]
MKQGPIILIEDDEDDALLFKEALEDLRVPNLLRHFKVCPDAWEYLITTREKPFIIFCDINLPLQNGLDFKAQLDENLYLRQKSIPFVFYTTTSNQNDINHAYQAMVVQGFFIKPSEFQRVKQTLSAIMQYWAICKHPNS